MIGRCILRLESRTFFVKRSRRLKPQRLGSCLSTFSAGKQKIGNIVYGDAFKSVFRILAESAITEINLNAPPGRPYCRHFRS